MNFKKSFTKALVLIALTASISSCTTLNKTLREPNARVELTKNDFTLSEQVSAEAQSTKILNIDFSRLFLKETGTVEGGATAIGLASIPVIGNMLSDKTSNYALSELMNNNKGYDVIFYPQYETKVERPILGIGFIMKTVTVKTTARLGKLKN